LKWLYFERIVKPFDNTILNVKAKLPDYLENRFMNVKAKLPDYLENRLCVLC